MEPGTPQVSVLIPVFNDEQRLAKCLEALERQAYPKHGYEVVVVDNASTVDIKGVVARFGQARYCYEGTPGSYAARNRGLTVVRGEVIAFTDSDCIPADDWIERGVSTLQANTECGLVGGAITLFYKDPDHPTAVELYESLRAFPQQQYIEMANFGATANVFTYREVIDTVGNFDSELKSGGDAEWGKRVASAGYRLHYAADVKVAHPARSTYGEYYRKTVRVMSGLPAFRKADTSLMEIVGQLLKGIVPPVSGIRKIFGEARGMTSSQKMKLATVVLFLHYIWVFERLRLQIRRRKTCARVGD